MLPPEGNISGLKLSSFTRLTTASYYSPLASISYPHSFHYQEVKKLAIVLGFDQGALCCILEGLPLLPPVGNASGLELSNFTRLTTASCYGPLVSTSYRHSFHYQEVKKLVIALGLDHSGSGCVLPGQSMLRPEDDMYAFRLSNLTSRTTDHYNPLVSADFSYSFHCHEVRELLLVEVLKRYIFYSEWVFHDRPFLPPEDNMSASSLTGWTADRYNPLASTTFFQDLHYP